MSTWEATLLYGGWILSGCLVAFIIATWEHR